MRASGFTLIEVMVALAILGLTTGLAVSVFSTTLRSVQGVDQSAERWERDHNGRQWLAQLFASAEAPAEELGFVGAAESARFSAWVWSAEGWVVRTPVEIAIESGALVATTSTGRLPIFDSIRSARFDYLSGLGLEAEWAPAWNSPTSMPPLVRLRMSSAADGSVVDTLYFWIGLRG